MFSRSSHVRKCKRRRFRHPRVILLKTSTEPLIMGDKHVLHFYSPEHFYRPGTQKRKKVRSIWESNPGFQKLQESESEVITATPGTRG